MGRTFGLKGKTPIVKRTGNRFSCNMISAITNLGKLSFMVFSEDFTEDVFLKFLKRLTRQSYRLERFVSWSLEFPSSAISLIFSATLATKDQEFIQQTWNSLMSSCLGSKKSQQFYTPVVLQILNLSDWASCGTCPAQVVFNYIRYAAWYDIDDEILGAILAKTSFEEVSGVSEEELCNTLNDAWQLLVIRERTTLVECFSTRFADHICFDQNDLNPTTLPDNVKIQIAKELKKRNQDFSAVIFKAIVLEANEALASSFLDLLSKEERNTFFAKTLTGAICFLSQTFSKNSFIILRNLYKHYDFKISLHDVRENLFQPIIFLDPSEDSSFIMAILNYDASCYLREEFFPLDVRLFENLFSWVVSNDSIESFHMGIEQIMQSDRSQRKGYLLEGPR